MSTPSFTIDATPVLVQALRDKGTSVEIEPPVWEAERPLFFEAEHHP